MLCSDGVGVTVAVDSPFDFCFVRREFEHLEYVIDSGLGCMATHFRPSSTLVSVTIKSSRMLLSETET